MLVCGSVRLPCLGIRVSGFKKVTFKVWALIDLSWLRVHGSIVGYMLLWYL